MIVIFLCGEAGRLRIGQVLALGYGLHDITIQDTNAGSASRDTCLFNEDTAIVGNIASLYMQQIIVVTC